MEDGEQGVMRQRTDEPAPAYLRVAPMGIAVVDPDGRITDANPALEDLLGYPGSELRGRRFTELVDDGAESIDDALARLRSGDAERFAHEARVRCADGSVLWVELGASATGTTRGRELVVAVQDITERKLEHQAVVDERDLLKRVVTSSADAICLIELSGKIIEWNPAAERLFGWKKEEIVGKPLSTLVPPRAGDQADDILKRERRGEIVDEIVPRLRKDGTVFAAELTASGVRDRSGEIIGYVGSYRDVTERLLVETASSAVASDLDPLEAFTRFAEVLKEVCPFTQLTLGVIEGDAYRRVVSVGERAVEFTRNETVELEGNSMQQAVETNAPVIVYDTRESPWPFDAKLADRGIGSYVIIPLAQEGRVFATINLGFGDAHVPTDKLVHFLTSVAQGVAHGVKNILLYEQQTESLERLKAVDEMKNSFLQAVSHELRTPLTVVLGAAHALERQFDSLDVASRKELVGMLVFNANKLQRLLTDLLDLDRLTRGVLTPSLRPVDLGALVQQVAQEVDSEGRTVEVEADDVEADDVEVLADGAKVERIVENLLVNAVRHTPEGTRIWARAENTPEGALVVVEDDGPGVADHLKGSIFELFRQGSEQSVAGTGVGLTLVTRFAELHGGRAWVEDRPQGGASFRVLLPQQPGGGDGE